MANDQLDISYKCNECGGTELSYSNNQTDDSIVSCKKCGLELGKWGDIKAQAMKAIEADLKKKYKKVSKGPNHWKVK